MAESDALKRLQDLAGSVGSVIAPVTLITAMLFYFGYVYANVLYGWFGLDVNTIGLSTQDFVMRSPPPLLSPLLVAGLLGAAVAAVNGAIRRRIAAAADTPWRLRTFRRLGTGIGVAGRLLMVAGVVLVLGYGWARTLVPFYDLMAPAVLATGAALGAYAVRLDALLGRGGRRAVAVALSAVVAVSLFWGTARLAESIARGDAVRLAGSLGTQLPAVVLDTKERLYPTSPGVSEQELPAAAGQEFRYRYSHLRLLIQGKDRLFLVPDRWSRGGATLMVPLDGAVRVQFPFG